MSSGYSEPECGREIESGPERVAGQIWIGFAPQGRGHLTHCAYGLRTAFKVKDFSCRACKECRRRNGPVHD
jgi:hypothetical protein